MADDKNFNVRSEILSTVAKTNDDTMRAVLLLMLGVLDEIGNKIDDIRKDETWLRESVLNGHAPNHDKHHAWVAERMAEKCESVCAWSRHKMEEENLNRQSKRGIRDDIIKNLIWGALVLAAGALGWNLKG